MNNPVPIKARDSRGKDTTLIIKPSNIRIWIHDKDISKLTKVLWAGQGYRLRTETSTSPKVKKFLDATPYILNLIKDIHTAAVDNDLETLKAKTSPSVPRIVLSSKDTNGLTALHKAAGLAHTRLVEYLLSLWPSAASETDCAGRTPLHYAASAKNNDRCFNLLVQAGSDETALDQKNKTAGYYKHKPNDIDRSVLTVIPDAPRIPNTPEPIEFDWSVIGEDTTKHVSKLKSNFLSENNISSILSKEPSSLNLNHENSFEKGRMGNLSARSMQDNLDNTSEPDLISETPETVIVQELNGVEDEIDKKFTQEEEAAMTAVDDSNLRSSKEGTETIMGNEIENDFIENETEPEPSELETKDLQNSENLNNINNNTDIDMNDNENENLSNQNEDGDDNDENIDINNNVDENNLEIDENQPENEEKDEGEEEKSNENDDVENEEKESNEENNEKFDENEINNEEDEEEKNEDEYNEDNNDGDDENEIENKNDNYEDEYDEDEYTGYKISEDNLINSSSAKSKKSIKSNDKTCEDGENCGSDYDDEKIEKKSFVENFNSAKSFRTYNHVHDPDNENSEDEMERLNNTKVNENNQPADIFIVNNDEETFDDDDNGNGNVENDLDEEIVTTEINEGNKNDEIHDEEKVESPSPALEIEGHVEGEPTETGQLESEGGLISHEDEDARIQSIIDSGDMEQLASLVLNGQGAKLVGMTSGQPEIQAFLDNVTSYMNKIRRVHLAAREGSLRDLQAALDRRKFAVARDNVSANGATPLHVATIFGHSAIVRYLAGRFPETTSAIDKNGRTALHYAATIHDNGHFYNLLIHLGANPKVQDNEGYTPEFYLNHERASKIFSHRHLLKDYGAEEEMADEMLIDQVPDDLHSARRPLDDPDILSTLERCFKLIHEPYRPQHSLELPSNSVPGSASSLRISITNYLARFLKRSVFDKIKYRQTRLDHNLFDLIWPAMKKVTQERRIDEDLNSGVVAPDFDVFVVFQEFLVPLIKDLNCLDMNHEFQPHPKTFYYPENLSQLLMEQTNNESFMTVDEKSGYISFNLDPTNKFILSGVIEVSRNLENFELPLNLNIGELEQAERVLTGRLLSLEFSKAIGESDLGVYYTMNEILENPSEIRTILATNGLLIPLLDSNDESQLAESIAINGQFWPYGRGVYVSSFGDLVAWVNAQEHLRLLCCSTNDTPGDLGQPYSKMARAIKFLEEKIQFRYSYFLGNLASRPSFLGTSIRFTYTLDLPHLIKEKENLRHLCTVRGLHLKTSTVYQDIVRISNMQCLGVTEWKIFQDFSTAVANILQLEKDLSLSNSKHIAAMLVKIFRKKKNSLIET